MFFQCFSTTKTNIETLKISQKHFPIAHKSSQCPFLSHLIAREETKKIKSRERKSVNEKQTRKCAQSNETKWKDILSCDLWWIDRRRRHQHYTSLKLRCRKKKKEHWETDRVVMMAMINPSFICGHWIQFLSCISLSCFDVFSSSSSRAGDLKVVAIHSHHCTTYW